jgi:heterodisulfide reductase subunit A-like polyferredoxin
MLAFWALCLGGGIAAGLPAAITLAASGTPVWLRLASVVLAVGAVAVALAGIVGVLEVMI